ncbi:MAG: hypothetical protein E7176_06885 [Erysipelotrichaceae bacterium]|nr:hypothetical protein [Erysipelotrichaceae bacterium]
MQNKRAKQFMPFDALTGYFELINEAEKLEINKRELTPDEEYKLNRVFLELKKGMVVHIVYYDKDAYYSKEGIISNINIELKYITIVKTRILFENILDIEIL